MPSVSIIVPARNEARCIAATVRNLLALSYPRQLLEVIVVDDGSSDKTAAIARAAGAKVIRKAHRPADHKAAAVNVGLRAAKGQIVAIVDADSYPEQAALLKTVPLFADPAVAAVTTRILVRKPSSLLGRIQEIEYALIAWSRKLTEYIGAIWATPGPLSLYRTRILRRLGGFDEKNMTEDIEIAWRLLSRGYKILMSSARTWTAVPGSWRAWWRQRLRWNIGGMQTTAKYLSMAFKPGSGSFGFFVVPFFSLSYVITMAAMGLLLYILTAWALHGILLLAAAAAAGIAIAPPILLPPNAFTVLGIMLLALSLVIVWLGLGKVIYRKKLAILFYLTLYIFILPPLLAHSLLRIAAGYRLW